MFRFPGSQECCFLDLIYFNWTNKPFQKSEHKHNVIVYLKLHFHSFFLIMLSVWYTFGGNSKKSSFEFSSSEPLTCLPPNTVVIVFETKLGISIGDLWSIFFKSNVNMNQLPGKFHHEDNCLYSPRSKRQKIYNRERVS